MTTSNVAHQSKRRKQEFHGMTSTPEYETWGRVIQRCTNPNNGKYEYYGGRGITVCEEWANSFIAFFNDMGEKPSPEYSIERIDNEDGYHKDNCRWATFQEQSENRRDNKFITYDGITDTYSGWSRRLGFGSETVKMRIYRGMSEKEAIETPLRTDRRPFKVFNADTGKEIGVWDSHPECADDLNLKRRNVSAVLVNKQHTTGGYTMEYI